MPFYVDGYPREIHDVKSKSSCIYAWRYMWANVESKPHLNIIYIYISICRDVVARYRGRIRDYIRDTLYSIIIYYYAFTLPFRYVYTICTVESLYNYIWPCLCIILSSVTSTIRAPAAARLQRRRVLATVIYCAVTYNIIVGKVWVTSQEQKKKLNENLTTLTVSISPGDFRILLNSGKLLARLIVCGARFQRPTSEIKKLKENNKTVLIVISSAWKLKKK
jgi:hypothetical protein